MHRLDDNQTIEMTPRGAWIGTALILAVIGLGIAWAIAHFGWIILIIPVAVAPLGIVLWAKSRLMAAIVVGMMILGFFSLDTPPSRDPGVLEPATEIPEPSTEIPLQPGEPVIPPLESPQEWEDRLREQGDWPPEAPTSPSTPRIRPERDSGGTPA